MSASRPRLGKGLGALLPTMEEYEEREQNPEVKLLKNDKPEESTAKTEQPRSAVAATVERTVATGETKQESKSHAAHASSKGNRKSSMKRASMPALSDVIAPTDVFFDNAANAPTVANVSRETTEPRSIVKGGYLAEIDIDDIFPNAHQPRTIFDDDDLEELSASIKEVGVLQPIVVRKATKPNKDGATYELIMGERRMRASKRAGLTKIPAIVRTTNDEDMLRDALLENLHRVALNPLEEAAAYQQMIDEFGLTQQQLSQSVSKSRPQIANTLRLLQLPGSVQKKVASGVLSAGHARALLSLKDAEAMDKLANRIVAEGLSVRSTEEIVSMMGKSEEEEPKKRTPRKDVWNDSDIPSRLEDHFDTKVAIKGTKKHGKIEITFSSPEDLDRIIALMNLGADAKPGDWV